MKLIHITTGDPDGIGLEVALKALSQIELVEGVHFVLWRSCHAPQDMFGLLDKGLKRVTLTNVDLLENAIAEAQKKMSSQHTGKHILWDLSLPETPALWVKTAGQFCLKNPDNEALVTGPLSKTQMQKEGFAERGHTPLLKKISQVRQVYMCFIGDSFNVVLLTGHLPLKKVEWNKEDLQQCIKLCLDFKEFLISRLTTDHRALSHFNFQSFSKSNFKSSDKATSLGQRAFLNWNLFNGIEGKKVGVLGFNPHAGEEGLLGSEEDGLKGILDQWKMQVEGPLVPDTAFFQENWSRFFMYICMYHDQGLIPFKMIHGRKSFQLSLGLPFMRVSVSHGTAKDIFRQNRGDFESMKRALLWPFLSGWTNGLNIMQNTVFHNR